jgi:V/A-type H+/Na+-transporting ATPase subunit E
MKTAVVLLINEEKVSTLFAYKKKRDLMTQDLQQLLEKINTDGVEKAKAEAAKIISHAEAQAKAKIEAAKQEAAQLVAQARQEATAHEKRAEESIRQAARDTLLNLEKSITTLLTNVLLKEVKTTLQTEGVVTQLVCDAVHAYLHNKGGMEVMVSQTWVQVLQAKLAAEASQGVKIITDTNTGAGFKIRLASGRIEHDFSANAIAETLAKQLRPQLAALLKG